LSNTLSDHDKILESPIAEDYLRSQVATIVLNKVTSSKSIDVNHVLQCFDTAVVPSPPRKSSLMNDQSLCCQSSTFHPLLV